ncbi:hypothetical protein HN011_010598 [Eciton burchellii]|nr:hypothetical protein HN011_010598 [Eciton burchellii]
MHASRLACDSHEETCAMCLRHVRRTLVKINATSLQNVFPGASFLRTKINAPSSKSAHLVGTDKQFCGISEMTELPQIAARFDHRRLRFDQFLLLSSEDEKEPTESSILAESSTRSTRYNTLG